MNARLQALCLLALSVVISPAQASVDPGAALAATKSHIAAKKYADAIALVGPALDATATIADPAQQNQARTALHFYAAVAYSGLGREDEARIALTDALRLSPNLRNIDPRQYSAKFVTLFQAARSGLGVATGRFEELYPGYSEGGSPSAGARASTMWEDPALEILGSRKEKRDWQAAVSRGEREKFMAAFWSQRDQTPGTDENGYRDAFTRRVSFADAAFEMPGQRGAMTDRGRVFALLGPPAAARRRPMTAQDSASMTAFNVGGMGLEFGSVESWTYSREQLPVSHPAATVTFRFVTHQGIGEHVLQKDGVATNLLTAATRAPRD